MKKARAEKALPKNSPTKRVGSGRLVSLWTKRIKTPRRKGWYITRTPDGFVSWRAWGNGAWWKQISGGWIESFNGDGTAMLYDWQPKSRKDVKLNVSDLPDLG